MTKVTIEQTPGGWQTYVRLKDVDRDLHDPYVQILLRDTRECLGPQGWENTSEKLLEVAQARDGKDLLLELEPDLIRYIDAGRPIEIQIRALGLSEAVLPPRLDPVPATHVGGPPVAERIPFRRGKGPVANPPGESEAKDEKEPPEPPITPLEKIRKELEAAKARAWQITAIAFVLGIAIGFGGTYAIDTTSNAPPQGDSAQLQRDKVRLQNEAFAPLNSDVMQLAATSPQGMSPDRLVPSYQPDRARAFYNLGIKNSTEGNKSEAVYWYKQAVRMCERDAFTFLGDAYYSGDGVPKDTRTGFQLLRCASALGSDQARDYLVRLLRGQSIPLAPPSYADDYSRGAR